MSDLAHRSMGFAPREDPAPPPWIPVCRVDALTPDRGVAALVDGEQVAIFLLSPLDDGSDAALYAIGNHDPLSGANVLARGLVGSAGDTVFVASPIFKQRFDLATGRCLDETDVMVPAHETRVHGGYVEVRLAR